MQKIGMVMGLAFVVGLLVIVGTRLSDDALAVLAGVACAGSAMVPVCIVLIWALIRRTRGGEMPPSGGQSSHYPPVIVVNPNGIQELPYGPPRHSLPAPARNRDFRVVGSDVVDAEWAE